MISATNHAKNMARLRNDVVSCPLFYGLVIIISCTDVIDFKILFVDQTVVSFV